MRYTCRRYIPFGPFLCIGAWNALHFANEWEALYWSVIKIHAHYCNGSILVEWLVGITIFLSLVSIGVSSIVMIPSRHELNRSTEEVVLAIKKVQLWAMLGHRDNRMAQGEFILKKHHIQYKKDSCHIM